jgi:uncharacterized protein (TIGR02996 family)
LTTPALPAPYLRAVLAMPDDDGPRLCAADWWDEQGAAERAEFVRVQCELARLEAAHMPLDAPCTCTRTDEDFRRYQAGEYCGACRRRRGPIEALRRRERELWRAGGDTDGRGWFAGCGLEGYVIYLVPSPDNMTAVVRRGFVEELTAAAADFLAHADALTAACPLRRVVLTTPPHLVVVNTDYTYALPGRLVTRVRWGDESWDSLSLRLLETEFPGIQFEMPAVEFRPGSLSPSQVPLTTDGAPALADPRTLIRGALP